MARLRSRTVSVQSADDSPRSTPGNYFAKSIAKAQGGSRTRTRTPRQSADQDPALQAQPQPAPKTKRKASSTSTTQASKRPKTTKSMRMTALQEEDDQQGGDNEDAPMNPDLVDALNASASNVNATKSNVDISATSSHNVPVRKVMGRTKRSSRRGRPPKKAAIPSPVREEEEGEVSDDDTEDEEERGEDEDVDQVQEQRHEGADQHVGAASHNEDEDGENQHQTNRSDSMLASRGRDTSPELGTESAGDKSRASIYDVPENDTRPRYLAASSVPASSIRRTINGLSAAGMKSSSSRPGPNLVPKRGLNMDDENFGYGSSETRHPAKDKRPLRPGLMRQHESNHSEAMQSFRDELASFRQEMLTGAAGGEDDADEDEEGSEDERNGGNEHGGHDGEEGNADSHPVPSAREQEFTVRASSTGIKTLQKIMARPAFVGRREWYKHIRSNGQNDPPPGTHPQGRSCIKILDNCIRLFKCAPKSPDLENQNTWFQERQEIISNGMAGVRKLISRIRESLASGTDDNRRTLMADVLGQIIPRMVRLLWTVGCLGGVERNEEGNVDISKMGVYNTFTLSYLRLVTGWLRQLNQPVQAENNISRVRNAEEEKKRKKNRMDFGAALDNWHEELVDVEEELEAKTKHESHIIQATQRDEIIRRQREEEEERENEVTNRKYEQFCESVQQVLSKPGPMEDKRRRLREALAQPPTQVVSPMVLENPRPRPPTPQLPKHRLPEEDRYWLLRQLRGTAEDPKQDPPTHDDLDYWVSILGASEQEVFEEVVYFIDRANYVAWERGIEPEPWAQIGEGQD